MSLQSKLSGSVLAPDVCVNEINDHQRIPLLISIPCCQPSKGGRSDEDLFISTYTVLPIKHASYVVWPTSVAVFGLMTDKDQQGNRPHIILTLADTECVPSFVCKHTESGGLPQVASS